MNQSYISAVQKLGAEFEKDPQLWISSDQTKYKAEAYLESVRYLSMLCFMIWVNIIEPLRHLKNVILDSNFHNNNS